MSYATAVVTGANRGIGLEVARLLGRRDVAVWLGCRDAAAGTEAVETLRAEGLDARPLTIDVADDASVAAAAERLSSETDALDILVNNAAINLQPTTGLTEESVDDIRATFEVNAFGPVRVTQALLPLLRAAESARVVMSTTGLGSIAETLDTTSENWSVQHAGYSASKTALNMFTVKFAKELMAEGIKVNAADPGLANTRIGNWFDRSPEEAAAVIVHLATIDGFGPTGGFFHDGHLDVLGRHRW